MAMSTFTLVVKSDASPDVEGIETMTRSSLAPASQSDASPDVEGIETEKLYFLNVF